MVKELFKRVFDSEASDRIALENRYVKILTGGDEGSFDELRGVRPASARRRRICRSTKRC
jgi:hypothetical protein